MLAAAGEQHVLFHARGGSLARGGGRIESIVRAAPAGADRWRAAHPRAGCDGQAGLWAAPDRHAHARARFQRAQPHHRGRCAAGSWRPIPPEQLQIAALLAQESRAAYRRLVWDDAQFYQFFQAVTPIDVIERMQIGSRSVHRAEGAGIAGCCPCRGCSPGRRRATCCRAGTAPAPGSPPWCEQHRPGARARGERRLVLPAQPHR